MDSEYWQQEFTDHLRLCGRSERTIKSYLVEVRYFLSFLEQRELKSPHQIQKADVEAYQVSLEHRLKTNGEPLSLPGKNMKVSTVRVFLKFLRRQNVLLTDPARDLVCPRVPKKLLPELPTEGEILRLLATPDVTTPLGLRNRAILELFYSSALRNTELRMLQVGDVDLVRLQVRVTQGKGGRQRQVPMGEEAADWIGEYLRSARATLLKEKEHGFLFMSFRGKPFEVNRLGDLVVKLAKEAGIEKRVTPHVLRHCCATHMLRNRVGLRHLQKLLGHVNSSSTEIYTRVEMRDLRDAHRAFHPRAGGLRDE